MSTRRSASPFKRLEQRALARDAVADPIGVGQRVAAPARLVAADEHVVGRVEEEDARGDAPWRCSSSSAAERSCEEVAGAHVDDERVARRRLVPAGQLGDLADEHRRQVVDHEEAEVLEHVRGLGTARRRTCR